MGKKGYDIGFVTDHYLVDKNTGEVKPIRLLTLGLKSKDENFSKFFNAFTEEILEDKELAGKPIQLLFYILSKLDINEFVFVLRWQEASEELQISRATFYRWLNVLLSRKIILPTKVKNVYLLNPSKVFIGTVSKAKKQFLEKAKLLGISDEVLKEISFDLEL